MGAHQYDVIVIGADWTGENVDQVVQGGLRALSQSGTEELIIIWHGWHGARLIPSCEPFASGALSDALGKRGRAPP